MEITNNQIYEKLISIELALQAINKINKSDKLQILENTTKDLKRMEPRQVESLLGVSRPWALRMMRKLSKEKHFTFIKGDMKYKRPSIILYEEENAKRERYEKAKEFIDKNGIVTFAQIRAHLKIPEKEGWFESVQIIANTLTSSKKEYYIEGNKVCKRTFNDKIG